MAEQLHKFDPDWVIRPGETLREWLDDLASQNVTLSMVKRITGLGEALDGVLDGSREITPDVARRLQLLPGPSAQFWLNLERNYRDGLAAGKTDASGEQTTVTERTD